MNRKWRYLGFALITASLIVLSGIVNGWGWVPVLAKTPSAPAPSLKLSLTPLPPEATPGEARLEPSEQQAQIDYESGRFAEALLHLQQALQAYQRQGNHLRQALALSNLALIYQQLGQWTEANQAIHQSFNLLEQLQTEQLQVEQLQAKDAQRIFTLQGLAQCWNIQGRLQWTQGQAESALDSWEQAAAVYQQLEDTKGLEQSQLNQAQALQALGFYRRAINHLTELNQSLAEQPPSLFQVTALRSLADALQVTGDLEQSRQVLEQAFRLVASLASLATPQTPALALSNAHAALHLSWANLIQVEATTQLHLNTLTPEAAVGLLNVTTPPHSLAAAALHQRQTTAALQFVQQIDTALQRYQQAIQTATSPTIQIQAELNQLHLLLTLQRWQQAAPLIPHLRTQLETLPTSQTQIDQQIRLALSWHQWEQAQQPSPHISKHLSKHTSEHITQHISNSPTHPPSATPATTHYPALNPSVARLLSLAIQQAKAMGDSRSQSLGWGSLGAIYEQAESWAEAEAATQQALILSQAINANDLSYRWQWQWGRLLKQRGDRSAAITAYTEAVSNLQTLRTDLVAINRDVQFSFQSQVEPVYRQLVDLLLSPDLSDGKARDMRTSNVQTPISRSRLLQARQVIEALQIAELDNFFREACLEAKYDLDQVIDQENVSASVFYTIVLPDRIEIILKLPKQDLLHYTTLVSQAEVESTIDELMAEIKRPYLSQRLRLVSKKVYDWLIQPAAAALQSHSVDTLVFLLDSSLRNLPIAALHDGQQFLIQRYGVALAPGLELIDPQPLQQRRFKVLAAGLSEARVNFSSLRFVQEEIADIQAELPSRVLLNQQFTPENLRQQLDASTFSVVHIATHGQFSSNAANTFILAWDRPILATELSRLLQTEDLSSPQPIELLVLSACRTAVGDRRAALGMAGIAVRAGARSTIASLWHLDDDSGAALMAQFYQALAQSPISKAEALRQAQLALLHNPQYAAPRFWASYVLLGNWL